SSILTVYGVFDFEGGIVGSPLVPHKARPREVIDGVNFDKLIVVPRILLECLTIDLFTIKIDIAILDIGASCD
ncbi:MAG: hypothetical protein KKF24_12845, partial [Gammaproteobacteria bacterium]|nr:hypothetical protein [Gammaproteobacteria bacterium]